MNHIVTLSDGGRASSILTLPEDEQYMLSSLTKDRVAVYSYPTISSGIQTFYYNIFNRNGELHSRHAITPWGQSVPLFEINAQEGMAIGIPYNSSESDNKLWVYRTDLYHHSERLTSFNLPAGYTTSDISLDFSKHYNGYTYVMMSVAAPMAVPSEKHVLAEINQHLDITHMIELVIPQTDLLFVSFDITNQKIFITTLCYGTDGILSGSVWESEPA